MGEVSGKRQNRIDDKWFGAVVVDDLKSKLIFSKQNVTST